MLVDYKNVKHELVPSNNQKSLKQPILIRLTFLDTLRKYKKNPLAWNPRDTTLFSPSRRSYCVLRMVPPGCKQGTPKSVGLDVTALHGSCPQLVYNPYEEGDTEAGRTGGKINTHEATVARKYI